VRGAFFNDIQNYNDSLIHVYALNSFRSATGEAEGKHDFNKNHHLNFGLNNTFICIKATNMPSEPKQNHTALFASYAYSGNSEKLRLNISGRQAWVPQMKIPLTYSAGINYNLFKSTSLYAQSARVYRNPTLNDLYWEPGGNITLLPENGYTHECGLKWAYHNQYFSMSTSPSVFSSRIYNWIMWLPEGNYWKPQNIMEVWSRGFETQSDISCHINDFQLRISLLTNYVLSGNQKLRSPNDNSIDKQLIYVPMYSGYAKLDATFKKWQLIYRQNYTGYRYLTSDNSQYLEPYMLSSASLAYTVYLKNATVHFFGQCYNLFNTVYQTVALRPMPLRHFSFGTSISFNKPNINNITF